MPSTLLIVPTPPLSPLSNKIPQNTAGLASAHNVDEKDEWKGIITTH
jgi:hypothetical protein